MQTIIVRLAPERLNNPDLDLVYAIPVALETATKNAISDNGYDYLADNTIAIWLSAENAEQSYPLVVQLFREEKFLENDLSQSAEIYISQEDTAEFDSCRLVYP